MIRAKLYGVVGVLIIAALVGAWVAGWTHGKAHQRELHSRAVSDYQRQVNEQQQEIARLQTDASERARQSEIIAAQNRSKMDQLQAEIRNANREIRSSGGCPDVDTDVVRVYNAAASGAGLPANPDTRQVDATEGGVAAARIAADEYGACARQINELIETLAPYL